MICSRLAHWLEQNSYKVCVVGSIPTSATLKGFLFRSVTMFYAVEYVHSDKNFVDSDGFREVFLYRFNTVKYRDYFVNEFPHIRDSISNTKARDIIARYVSKRSSLVYADLLKYSFPMLLSLFDSYSGYGSGGAMPILQM